MGLVKRWCRSLLAAFGSLSITLVHHMRKSANSKSADLTGLELAGSGSLYGMVDTTMMWGSNKDSTEGVDPATGALFRARVLRGQFNVESRGDAPVYGRWRLGEGDIIVRDDDARVVDSLGRGQPNETSNRVLSLLTQRGSQGLTVAEAEDELDMPKSAVRNALLRLRKRDVATTTKEGTADRYYLAGHSPATTDEGLLPEGSDDEFGPLPGH